MVYFDAPTDAPVRFTPQDLVGACNERDVWNVLFDEGALRPEFFDLSSGFAGDIVQKLVNYGIRVGAVVPDVTAYSEAFRDFAREATDPVPSDSSGTVPKRLRGSRDPDRARPVRSAAQK